MHQAEPFRRIRLFSSLRHEGVKFFTAGVVVIIGIPCPVHGQKCVGIREVRGPAHPAQLVISRPSCGNIDLLLLGLKFHLDPQILFPLGLKRLRDIAVDLQARIFVGHLREPFSVRISCLRQKLSGPLRIKGNRILSRLVRPVFAAGRGQQVFRDEKSASLKGRTAGLRNLLPIHRQGERLTDAHIVERRFFHIEKYVIAGNRRPHLQLVAARVFVHDNIVGGDKIQISRAIRVDDGLGIVHDNLLDRLRGDPVRLHIGFVLFIQTVLVRYILRQIIGAAAHQRIHIVSHRPVAVGLRLQFTVGRHIDRKHKQLFKIGTRTCQIKDDGLVVRTGDSQPAHVALTVVHFLCPLYDKKHRGVSALALRIQRPGDCVQEICAGHIVAVVPLCFLPDMYGIAGHIVADVNALRQNIVPASVLLHLHQRRHTHIVIGPPPERAVSRAVQGTGLCAHRCNNRVVCVDSGGKTVPLPASRHGTRRQNRHCQRSRPFPDFFHMLSSSLFFLCLSQDGNRSAS